MRGFPTPSIAARGESTIGLLYFHHGLLWQKNAIFSLLGNAIACRITPIAGNLADFFADMRV